MHLFLFLMQETLFFVKIKSYRRDCDAFSPWNLGRKERKTGQWESAQYTMNHSDG